MLKSEDPLPSDKSFGFFFTMIFGILGTYFSLNEMLKTALVMFLLSLTLFTLTLKNAEILSPFKKIWMNIGIILGKIFNPIILGVIFFGLITPTGILMRLFMRDELGIRSTNQSSNWKYRTEAVRIDAFKEQF